MGRLVFAVPGSPLDPRAQGTNTLLKSGATLTTSAEDVLEAIAPLDDRGAARQPSPISLFEPGDTMELPPDDDQRAQIVSLLGPAPVSIDDIIGHTGLEPSKVFLAILELDLANRIERHSANRVSLLPAAR
jgi:DNA processing protein